MFKFRFAVAFCLLPISCTKAVVSDIKGIDDIESVRPHSSSNMVTCIETSNSPEYIEFGKTATDVKSGNACEANAKRTRAQIKKCEKLDSLVTKKQWKSFTKEMQMTKLSCKASGIQKSFLLFTKLGLSGKEDVDYICYGAGSGLQTEKMYQYEGARSCKLTVTHNDASPVQSTQKDEEPVSEFQQEEISQPVVPTFSQEEYSKPVVSTQQEESLF